MLTRSSLSSIKEEGFQFSNSLVLVVCVFSHGHLSYTSGHWLWSLYFSDTKASRKAMFTMPKDNHTEKCWVKIWGLVFH